MGGFCYLWTIIVSPGFLSLCLSKANHTAAGFNLIFSIQIWVLSNPISQNVEQLLYIFNHSHIAKGKRSTVYKENFSSKGLKKQNLKKCPANNTAEFLQCSVVYFFLQMERLFCHFIFSKRIQLSRNVLPAFRKSLFDRNSSYAVSLCFDTLLQLNLWHESGLVFLRQSPPLIQKEHMVERLAGP